MKTKIGVVIPSFNSAKDLPGLLQSLSRQKLASVEMAVVLVDNYSTDDSVSVAKKSFPEIFLIQNKQNMGIAEGNNIGIRKALDLGAEGIIVINADTLTDPNLIEALTWGWGRHPDSLLSPKIYFAPGREFHCNSYKPSERGKVIWYAGGTIDWANVIASHRGVNQVDTGQFDQEVKTDFATGCCMFIPGKLARKTGGFDSRYYLYYEDSELSERIKRQGGEIWYVPQAVLWHTNAGSSGVGSTLQDYYITRNRLIFGLKYAPIRARIALIRESLRLLYSGRSWQRRGVVDFYLHNLGKGSFR